ncbi:hypothetical protein V5F49_11275 [Xanthobacter sp. V3C-3]|uniref:hypothetical protein n=1 Tax=Xanthobacter lutulentifluminis TaxID=3119935 RepID=UPI00372AE68E
MAFDDKSFRGHSRGAALPTAGSRSLRDWRYATNDDHATVAAAGYFNNARAFIGIGDTVVASVSMGTTPQLREYIFTAVPASGNVTVAQVNNT